MPLPFVEFDKEVVVQAFDHKRLPDCPLQALQDSAGTFREYILEAGTQYNLIREFHTGFSRMGSV
jgi:hypothetical protein